MTTQTLSESTVADGCVSIDEASEFLGISRAGVYGLMATGQLVYAQAGRRRLVTRQSMRAWLASRIVPPATPTEATA